MLSPTVARLFCSDIDAGINTHPVSATTVGPFLLLLYLFIPGNILVINT